MGAGLRPGAKAPEESPDPTGGAPALDPTDERRLETEPRRGVRYRLRAKAAGNSYPHPPTATAPVVDSTRSPTDLVTLGWCLVASVLFPLTAVACFCVRARGPPCDDRLGHVRYRGGHRLSAGGKRSPRPRKFPLVRPVGFLRAVRRFSSRCAPGRYDRWCWCKSVRSVRGMWDGVPLARHERNPAPLFELVRLTRHHALANAPPLWRRSGTHSRP